MFEGLSSNVIRLRRRSVLGWLSVGLLILSIYFLTFTRHDSWALLCTTAGCLLFSIDLSLKKEPEHPHIDWR